MRDVRVAELAGRQFNRVSRHQLRGLGLSERAIKHLVALGRLVIVEENPYQGGWGGTVASIVAEEGFYDLDAPIRRVAGACVPLPFAANLEQAVTPTADRVATAVREALDAG